MSEYETFRARETGNLIEIELPSGSVKVRHIREIGDSPVVGANLRQFEDGGFQVAHVEYEGGSCSRYLGNVFLNKDESGECY